jgi:hypothetical protein
VKHQVISNRKRRNIIFDISFVRFCFICFCCFCCCCCCLLFNKDCEENQILSNETIGTNWLSRHTTSPQRNLREQKNTTRDDVSCIFTQTRTREKRTQK